MILAGADAQAHFLFVRILPAAEAGRAAEVYFSELAEAGDPRFIDKIAHTQLWMQTTPGQFQPVKVRKANDRLRAFLPGTGSVGVVGVCEYGVLARPNAVPFLLRHYPKAIAGNANDLNRLLPRKEVPMEIVATIEDDRLRLSLLRNGKPAPGAKFTTVDAYLVNDEFVADSDGKASWKPAESGRYSVYTSQTLKEAGEAGGKKYDEIREFATLAFTWPLEPASADPKVAALFEDALASRAAWKNFPGFTAHVAGKMDGRSFTGEVKVSAEGTVDIVTEETVVKPWLTEQLESIVLHRQARTSGDQARPRLHFADEEEDHPLGRLVVFEGGRFASSYRIKDKQLMVVNRQMGKSNFTITVLDNERNTDGRFLPRSYVVQYWDATSGDLLRTETVYERWRRFGSWDLPTSHTVTTASATGLSVRGFTLTKHNLNDAK